MGELFLVISSNQKIFDGGQEKMKIKKIVVVDDDDFHRNWLYEMVRYDGYDCLSIEDSTRALNIIKQYDPDLILVDVLMPGMDGFELTRLIKADDKTRNTPVILVTALSDQDSRIKGLASGAEEFISKPVDRVELSMRIRNLLRLKEYHDLLTNHNEQLEAQVRARTDELRETQLEVVRSLGRAAEFRDCETGLHIVRMSEISRLMAQACGLGEARAELILNASPMHDIGKVGIPDNILLKRGGLTASEWSVMQSHVTIGHRILSSEKSSDLMDMARLIALSHHEKWNGSGYPNALKETAIPIEARIVALADVFDALTSARSYKNAWTVDEALTEINRQRNKHFESRLVDVFIDILPDVVKIKDRYCDETAAA